MTNAHRSMVSRLIRYFGAGETVSLYRYHSLTSRITGGVATPLLKAALAGGESSFTLDGGLSGKVPSGLVVTLDGVDYTTTSSAEASGGEITLAVTPVIAGAVAENAPATLADYVEISYQRVRGEFRSDEITEPAEWGYRKVHLSADGDPSAPEIGDLLIDSVTGDRERVVRVAKLGPVAAVAGWTVYVGDAA